MNFKASTGQVIILTNHFMNCVIDCKKISLNRRWWQDLKSHYRLGYDIYSALN